MIKLSEQFKALLFIAFVHVRVLNTLVFAKKLLPV